MSLLVFTRNAHMYLYFLEDSWAEDVYAGVDHVGDKDLWFLHEPVDLPTAWLGCTPPCHTYLAPQPLSPARRVTQHDLLDIPRQLPRMKLQGILSAFTIIYILSNTIPLIA